MVYLVRRNLPLLQGSHRRKPMTVLKVLAYLKLDPAFVRVYGHVAFVVGFYWTLSMECDPTSTRVLQMRAMPASKRKGP